MRSLNFLETGQDSETTYIIHLVRNDGCRYHCIGLMGDMIYDGCNNFTLTRTKECLYHACRPSKFHRVLAVLEMCDDEKAIQQIKDKEANRKKRRTRIAKTGITYDNKGRKKKVILFRINLGKH